MNNDYYHKTEKDPCFLATKILQVLISAPLLYRKELPCFFAFHRALAVYSLLDKCITTFSVLIVELY